MIYFIYNSHHIQGVPRDFSHSQEDRWDRDEYKSPIPFSDICNNNRDINF